MCKEGTTHDFEVMNALSLDYRTEYTGFTLGLVGGPGASKSFLIASASGEQQRPIMMKRVGELAGLSTLKEGLAVFTDDPALEGYILVLSKPLMAPIDFHNQKNLFYKVIAERIFEYEDEDDTEDLLNDLAEEFTERLQEFRNTVKSFKLLGEDEITYFKLLSEAILSISKSDIERIKTSAIAAVSPRPSSKKKLYREAKNKISATMEAFFETQGDDSELINRLKKAIDYANEGINDIYNNQFYRLDGLSPAETSEKGDAFTHYRLIDVQGDLNPSDEMFIENLFCNNNKDRISLEVACDKLEIRVPMNELLERNLKSQSNINSLSNGSSISFALHDMPGLMHFESNDDELRGALEARLANRRLDGVIYSVPADTPPLSDDVLRIMKRTLKEFESDLPLFLLTGHGDKFFEDRVKDLRQSMSLSKASEEAYSELRKLDYERKESLKQIVRGKRHRIKILGSSPIALKDTLVDYPRFKNETCAESVLEKTIVAFLINDNFYSSKIPYYPNEVGGGVELEIDEDMVRAILTGYLNSDRFIKRIKSLLYTSFSKNSLGPTEFIHPSTRVGFGYAIRGGRDFYSTLNEAYWVQNYKRIDFQYFNALREFFEYDLRVLLVSRCVKLPYGKIDEEYQEAFIEKIKSKMSVFTFIKHLMYSQLYRPLLHDGKFHSDTRFYRKYVENAILLLTDESNVEGYLKATMYTLEAAIHDVEEWGIIVR